MCGLVGAAGALYKREVDAFLTMLAVDTIRGEHSTGVGYVKRDSRAGFYKNTEPGWSFISDPRLHKTLEGFANKALIGHNRWATKGKVISKNAHPFLEDNILGAHNGTISNPEDLTEGKVLEVDSHALIAEIALVGLPDAIKKVRGAWAIVFYNQDDNTMNFIRNDQRPLYLARGKDGKTIWWASEKWMFDAGPRREKIEIEEPELIPTDTWISWEVPEANAAFGKPFLKTGVAGAPVAATTYAGTHWWSRNDASFHNTGQGDVVRSGAAGGVPGGNVPKQVQTVASTTSPTGGQAGKAGVTVRKGPNGSHISEELYTQLTGCGCHWCGEQLFENEAPKFFRGPQEDGFKPLDSWACPDCVKGIEDVEDFDDFGEVVRLSAQYSLAQDDWDTVIGKVVVGSNTLN